MATEKELPKPTKDSEEVFVIRCSPCSDKGAKKEAEKFCVDCRSYLCDTCLLYHKQFPALQSHQFVDKSYGGSNSTEMCVLKRCSFHPGHYINRYCKDHDEICCEACITIKHRSCVNVNNLTDVAKGIKDSKEHKDIKEDLASIIKQIKQEMEKRTKTLSCLDQNKDSVLRDIDEFKDKVMKRIKELVEVSKKEVVCKHAERVKTVQSDIKELETVLSVAEETAKNVCASGLNEAQVLMNVKDGQRVIKDVGVTVKALSNKQDQHDFYFKFDDRLSDIVTEMTSLGVFDDDNESHSIVAKYKVVNANSKEVNAICMFENGTFAFIDCVRETITRLESDYAVIGTWKLNLHPVSLCASGPQEVAVAIRDENRIQFIAWEDETFSIEDSFLIPQNCTALSYDSSCDHMYICFAGRWGWNKSGRIDICKRNGTLLKTYEKDETGTLFSSPNSIAISHNTVFVTDSRNGLVALNKDGKKLWTYSDRKLQNASGVCLLSDTQLLVTGLSSNNILHVATDGREICEVLGTGESLNSPCTVVFDKLNSRIMVGCRSCKNVSSLTEVAKGIKRSKVHNDTVEGLNSTVKTAKQEKEQRNRTLSCLDKNKDSALQDIEEFQDKLINRIKELAEVSRKEVIYKHVERATTFKSEVNELETVLSVAEDCVKKVSASGLKEEQLFVNVNSGKTIIRDVGSIFTEFSYTKTQNEFRYCCEEKLAYAVTSMKSLGDIKDILYPATKYKSINVSSKEINAVSQFEDGTFAFVDFMNDTLTRLSDNYAVRDTISLAGSPISLCVTGPQEVAVALREEKKVQFVACDKTLSLGNSFTTKMICTGLCYDPTFDHLYVCLGAKWKGDKSACVSVYKKDGALLKTYVNYKTGTQIFSSPNHIAIGLDSIFIADRENGVIALNKNGKRLWKFEDEKLKGAWGVCILFDGTLLVTGCYSNNVLQLSADGKEICELLGSSAGVNHPVSLAFDKCNSRILLGCLSSEINVYTLSR